MTAQCYTLWKVPTVRATKLDSCGQPVTGCSTVVTNGIISVNMTKEYEARQEFFKKNGDGTFCVQKTNPPIMKWINVTATFCGVDPELLNIMTADPVVRDDSASAVATGWTDQVGSAANANFALEAWTRLASVSNGAPCSGSEFGYTLLPWVVEGTVGDINLQNDSVDFVFTGRTSAGSLWGTGPYFIDLSDAAGTLNNNIALLTAIGSNDHRRTLVVRKAPPTASCGCSTLSSLTPS